MKTPEFWKKKGLLSYLFLPLSFIYIFISNLKKDSTITKWVNIPVICIGNATAGGAGKTPTALVIGDILKKHKIKFGYLSRGYKGKFTDIARVNLEEHTSADVGDEPLILSKVAPAFVAKNRYRGASIIANHQEFKAIVMDDGLQNYSIKKDLSILVVDGKYGFGNEYILPAGPLREKVKDAIKKVKLVLIVGDDEKNICHKFGLRKNVIFAEIKPVNKKDFKGKKVIAFAGIGRPRKFFDSLEESGAEIVKEYMFGDHYSYKDSDLAEIISEAKKEKAIIVTTEKDWVRLNPKYKDLVKYLEIELSFSNKDDYKKLEEVVLSSIKNYKRKWIKKR